MSVDETPERIVHAEDQLPDFLPHMDEQTWRACRADTLTEWSLEAATSSDPVNLARAQVWATLAGVEWQAAEHACADERLLALTGIAEVLEGPRPPAPLWLRTWRWLLR